MPDHLARRPPWKHMHEGGHYSLQGTLFTGDNCLGGGQYSPVNNVRGDIIHADNVTHVRKYTRPSPAFPYCKRRKAGRGLGTRLQFRNIFIHVPLSHPLTDPITLHTHDAGGSGAGLLNLSNISTTTVPQHPCKHHPNLPSLNDNTKTCLLTLSLSSPLLFLLLFLPPSPRSSPPFPLSPPPPSLLLFQMRQ